MAVVRAPLTLPPNAIGEPLTSAIAKEVRLPSAELARSLDSTHAPSRVVMSNVSVGMMPLVLFPPATMISPLMQIAAPPSWRWFSELAASSQMTEVSPGIR